MQQPDITAELKKLERLVGQHPAALRSVSWDAHGHHEPLAHLELETKHGHVVVFDHRQPMIYTSPARPPQAQSARSWHDLSELIPEAFDDRPVLTAVDYQSNPVGWLIRLSTGVTVRYLLDPEKPTLSAQ